MATNLLTRDQIAELNLKGLREQADLLNVKHECLKKGALLLTILSTLDKSTDALRLQSSIDFEVEKASRLLQLRQQQLEAELRARQQAIDLDDQTDYARDRRAQQERERAQQERERAQQEREREEQECERAEQER